MRVRILASDSMGVRSMATAVETSEGLILIDPGASLAPRRYGLPPHPVELEALERSLDVIRDAMREASIIVITHYHYDHYIRGEPELYKNRILLVKHPSRNINRSQALRSYRLLKDRGDGVESIAKEVVYADGQTYSFGRVKIEFSPPVWHGYPGTRVGRVIMVRIVEEDDAFVFTSDVQGPADPEALRVLSGWVSPRPRIVYADGPPTYFAGFKVPRSHVEAGLEGMSIMAATVKPEILVVDHHLLRDLNYRESLKSLIEGDIISRVVTAAELMGLEPNLLEARRRELWKGEG